MKLFDLDYSEVINFFRNLRTRGIDFNSTKKSLEKIAEVALKEWKAQAINTSQSQARWFGIKYAENIDIIKYDMDNLSVKIGPKNEIGINAMKVVENGRQKYDMKPALLRAKNKRYGKNGVYTVIKFENGFEVESERGSGQNFKSMSKENNEVGTMKLDSKGMNTRDTITDYTSKSFGNAIGSGRTEIQNKLSLKGIFNRIKNLFQNKLSKKSRGVDHNQSLQFRVVKSDSKGWVYPEIRPENVKDIVYASIKDLMRESIEINYQKDVMNSVSRAKR